MKFPGVGNKITNLFLYESSYKQNVGIAVDTHVHRIANRLEWVKSKVPD